MIVSGELGNLVRLGDYIEIYDKKNVASNDLPFYGINKDKTFMPTVADTNELDRSKYKIVEKDVFVFSGMQTGRDVCIRLALYENDDSILVSPAYTTFIIKDKTVILPEFLFIQFNRFQMDRYGWFLSDGSVRSNLDWPVFCDIQIPLPDTETQQELVDTYNGLKALAEQNEALIQPLTEACQAYIVDCKKKYPEVELGGYIEEIDERNSTNEVTLTQGVDVNMQFISAKREAADKEGTKIVRTGQFAFNKVVKANGTKLPIALRTGPDCIISSSYAVFHINNADLDSKFLRLWFSRSEVHRYCGFISQGTTRDVFSFEDLSNMKLPIPPIEVQQAIVNIYNCAEEAKKIASEAREKMKTLCPALVQKAING
jgi:type I restriction enzyme S subunit